MVVKQQYDSIDIKIKYFPFGGRGTAVRLAAYIGNLTFEDEFISFDDFESIRNNKCIKWCTLPQIIIYDKDNKKQSLIGQSNTCLRYIGFKCNLYPSDPIQAANCDEIMDFVEDIMLLLAPSEFCGDDNKKMKLRKELSKTKLPIWLKKLEWRLQENIQNGYKNGYIVGDSLTIADCKLWCFIRHFGHCKWREGYYKYIDQNILHNLPLLKKYKQFIGNIKIIKIFNKKWRERHKGFKLNNPNYPACFVWNKHNQPQQKHKQQEYENNNIKESFINFIILSIILFLLLLISDNPLIAFAVILFWGLHIKDDTTLKKV